MQLIHPIEAKENPRGMPRGMLRVPDAVQRSYTAPQSRDLSPPNTDRGPRISNASRRKRGALRSIRGT
jgi:hypothetical protein